MRVIKQWPDKLVSCTCGSTAVIDANRHSENCHRRLWRDLRDEYDALAADYRGAVAENARLRELVELRAQDGMGPVQRGAWDDLKADRDRLRAENERYRTAIKTALDTMAVANDEQLGQGGVARKAYAHLWHEYFAIPAGIERSGAIDEQQRLPTPEQVERVREIHQAKRAVRGPEPDEEGRSDA